MKVTMTENQLRELLYTAECKEAKKLHESSQAYAELIESRSIESWIGSLSIEEVIEELLKHNFDMCEK